MIQRVPDKRLSPARNFYGPVYHRGPKWLNLVARSDTWDGLGRDYIKIQLLPQSHMGAPLRKDDLKLLLLEEDSDEPVYAGGYFCGRDLGHLHFAIFLELQHLAQSVETAPKQKTGLFWGRVAETALGRLARWWAFTKFLHYCFLRSKYIWLISFFDGLIQKNVQ